MNNQATINVMNTLIVTNNDRIEGYETATKETEEADLKDLFQRFIKTSKLCKSELVVAVKSLQEAHFLSKDVYHGSNFSNLLFNFYNPKQIQDFDLDIVRNSLLLKK